MTAQVWNCIIPCWLAAICENISAIDLEKLEKILNALFDKDLSPLPFEVRKMFDFIFHKFKQVDMNERENALEWLQILSEAGVYISVESLLEMFSIAESNLSSPGCADNVDIMTSQVGREWSKDGRAAKLSEKELKEMMKNSQNKSMRTLQDALEAMNVICTGPSQGKKCEGATTFHGNVNENKRKTSQNNSRTSRIINSSSFFKTKRLSSRYRRRNSVVEQKEGEVVKPPGKKRPAMNLPTPDVKQFTGNSVKLTPELNACRRIACYVDMLDIIHKQLLLQNCLKNEGLGVEESLQVASLCNKLLTHLLEMNQRHDLSDDDLYRKMELQQTNCLFSAILDLLHFILPSNQQKVPENKVDSDWANSPSLFNVSGRKNKVLKTDDFDDYVLSVRIIYRLAMLLTCYEEDYAITLKIIGSISLLCFSKNVLDVMSKIDDQVMRIFEAEIFLPSMWRQLKLRHSDLSSQVALVVLHCVNILPGSFKILMDLFDSPFHAKLNWAHGDVTIEDWSPQFVVVDQIHTILLNVDKSFVDERTPLTYVVSYALCLILAASSQPNTALHTKARFVIKSLSTKNLENAYTCLKHEYDKSVLDRTFILSQFLLLHQLRPDSSALSFHNFTHFMDVLAIDATLYNLLGIPFPFPAAACSQKLPPEAKKQRVSHQVAGYKGGTGATFAERIQKAHLDVEISSLKTMSGTTINCEHKTVDDSLSSSEVENEVDHEIVNHLMFIITKYMIGCENDVKSEDKRKDFRTFLRQIYAWLNYNEVVGYFACPPSVLRSVAGINTFLLNLPQILDHNQTLGNLLLPMVLALLDMVSKSSDASSVETQCAVCHMCALDHLVEPIKIAWLSTIRIIMYKYELNEQSQQKQLLHLIQISMEVLEGEFHICGMGPVKGHDVEERAEKCQTTDLRSNPSTPAPPKPSVVQIPSSILEKNVFSVESKGGSSRYPASPLSQTSELDSKEDRPLLSHHREVGKLQSTYDNDPSDDETGSSEESQPGKDSPESHLQTTAPCQSKKKPLAKKEKEIIKTSSPQARCTKCNEIIKEYSYETLSHCVINLCHFVRFDPILGVPLLPRMLALFAYIGEPLLGGVKPTPVMFMAKQSMRCLLHQFAENHVFIRLFLIPFRADSKFIPVVAACLKGYQKLQYIDVLELVLQGLPEDLCELTSQDLSCLLSNLATFLHQVPAETSSPWQQVLGNFCAFFTKLHNFIANKGLFSADSLLDVMTSLLKSPATTQFKQSLLEPFSKLLSTSVTCCVFSVQQLFNLCSITNEMFNKEKDKLYLTRCVVSKLVSALKMNTNITGQNLLLLLQMVLLDGGSTIAPFTMSKLNKHLARASVEGKVSCCAMECMNPHIGDCLDILADDGFLSKIKSCSLSRSHDYHSDDVFKGLLEDEIKLSLAQLVAGQLQEKPLNNYFPCLYHPPSVVQLGPKEYNECVSHLKKLSWVLLGSLSHLALQQGSVENIWKPVCSDLGLNLATIVQVVLTGYLAQNKEPKVEMTSLFYAFIACQLWTVYCEQLSYYVPPTNPMTSACSYNPIGDDHVTEMSLLEFWSSVTPSILVLLEQDGQVSSNIRRHMLSLIQGLDKYESSLLFKLYPMWSQMLDPRPMNESILSIEREEKFQQFRQSDVIDSSRGARWNGERVLDIVLSINNKLIKLENDEGLCVV
ncbi:unnamed protein product [Clavelina lepadiformis]|uniref:Uncharacterized protein n=1 Tax=Clavelina lepadiformis TaxID=159417 RepID=A0ABP0G327_CLALP